MTAEKFLESLRPLLSKRRPEDAIAEIDGFLAAIERWKDNASIGPIEIARIRQARERIAGGKDL